MRSCLQIIPDEEMREIKARYDVLVSRGLPINDTMMSWAEEFLRRKAQGGIFGMPNPELLLDVTNPGWHSRMMDRIKLYLREDRYRRFDNGFKESYKPFSMASHIDGVVGNYAKGTDKLIN